MTIAFGSQQASRRRRHLAPRPDGPDKSSRGRLVLESLDRRLLLSVLDFADEIISEVEPNDTPAEAQPLPFDDDILGVGVEGGLSSTTDIDIFTFEIDQSGRIEFRFEPLGTGGPGHAIAAAALGPDNDLYFIAESGLWIQDADGEVNRRAHADTLAAALGVSTEALTLKDLAVLATGQTIIVTDNSGDVLQVAADGTVSIVVAEADLTALTGQAVAGAVAVVADGSGGFYLAEGASGGVIQATAATGPAAGFSLAWYTDPDTLQQAVQRDALADVSDFFAVIPHTVLARTEGAFVANSLVLGGGAYGPEQGEGQVFYTTQLGPSFDGDGSITRIVVNEDDPDAAIFTQFFAPDDAQLNLNPSALVLDTAGGAFGGKMYMGTFGPSLGDDQDGEIYVVEPDGTISLFNITAFVDRDGEPVLFDGAAVTGFFDVTDMAFGPGGAWGDYLYVLSENIDQTPDEPGGFMSDLWRVSPDGVAELFVPDIADGVISLAFDTAGDYDGDLFVGTFHEGLILRVSPDGAVEEFFDFRQFGGGLSVADIAFFPELPGMDLPSENRLVVTLHTGQESYLVQLEPDGETVRDWGGNLNTGDVSSGDIAFDEAGNLVIVEQANKTLTRFEYQAVAAYTLTGLGLRPDATDGETLIPYVSVMNAGQPRILQLSDSGEAEDTVTHVRPHLLDDAEADVETDKAVSFTFDAAGNIYVYAQNAGTLQRAALGEDGYASFTTVRTAEQIATGTGLVNPQISSLTWGSDGRLVAVGVDGPTDSDEDIDPAPHVQLVQLLNTQNAAQPTATQFDAANLTQMTVRFQGGGIDETYTAMAGAVLAQTFSGAATGQYYLTVSSVDGNFGDYELLLSLGGELEPTLTVPSGETLQLTTIDGETLLLSYAGPGQADLSLTRRASGRVIDLTSLTVTGRGLTAAVSLTNATEPGNITLPELVLSGLFGSIVVGGDVASVSAADNTYGMINTLTLGAVESVELPRHHVFNFTADTLGGADPNGYAFEAFSLRNLHVRGDVANVVFMDSAPNNTYWNVTIDGTMTASTLYGLGIMNFAINNVEGAAVGLGNSQIRMQNYGFGVWNTEINGNMTNTAVTAGNRISKWEVVGGDMVNSLLSANAHIGEVFVEGAVNAASSIQATNYFGSSIWQVRSGGNFAGQVSASRIDRILVGYDRDGHRRDETAGDYSGSNFTGSALGRYLINEVNATGSISGANISSPLGSVNSLLAEDGFNASVNCRMSIGRVMVGYLNGMRHAVVNSQANVSGSFNATVLGRLYYTGNLAENTNLPIFHGPIVKDR